MFGPNDGDDKDDDNGGDGADAGWYNTGYDGVAAMPDDDIDRVYLKQNEEMALLFLDGNLGDADRKMFNRPYGAPFLIWENQIPTKGDDGNVHWRNWVTSLRGRRGPDGKPLKDLVKELAPEIKPYYVGFFTVVALRDVKIERLLKSGDPIVEPRKLLLPAKKKLLKLLHKYAERRDGLRGCIYVAGRSDGQSASTGDDWQFEEKLTEAELKKLLPDGQDQPLVYHELLAPKPEEEIQALLDNRAKVDRDNNRGGGRGGRSERGDRGGGGRGRSRDDDDRERDDDRGSRRSSGYGSNRGGGGGGGNRERNARSDEDLPF